MIPKSTSSQVIRFPEVNQSNTALRISFTPFLARLSSPSVIKAASADVAHSIPALYKQQYNYTRLCHLVSSQKDPAWSTGGQRFPLMLCFLEGLALIPQYHLCIPTTQTDTQQPACPFLQLDTQKAGCLKLKAPLKIGAPNPPVFQQKNTQALVKTLFFLLTSSFPTSTIWMS